MKITGSYTFDAPRQQVWALIHNPASLLEVVPGCQQIEQTSPVEYKGRIEMKLPAIVGTYQTYIKLIEFDELQYCCFEGEVSGGPGAINGTASFKLSEANGQTTIDYEGQGLITGPLARLNDRFTEGIANTLINQGLAKLSQQLQQPEVESSAQ